MKKLPLVGRLLYDTPWAITPEMLAQIDRIYERHVNGEPLDIAAIEAQIGRPLNNEREAAPYDLVNGVAVIPIEGVIQKRMDLFTQISGGACVEQIGAAYKAALADPLCQAVLFKVDSPGGAVDGVFELAQSIFDARDEKPTCALAYGCMASAAYLIGAACERVYASDVATAVGSIGVVAIHKDRSAKDAASGVVTTEIYRGKYKRLISDGPLSDEGKSHLEDRVSYFYTLFVNAIAQFRGVSPETVLSTMSTDVHDLFIGRQALDAGLIDGIMPMDELVAAMPAGNAAVMRPNIPPKGASMELSAAILAALTHNSDIAPTEPDWGPYLDANRSKLPDNAFADPDKRAFPHHWVKNPGPVDKKTGRFSSGDLYLHVGGWKAAWAAANGARSGQKASPSVISHLSGHRPAIERFDKSKEKSQIHKEATMDDTIITVAQLREAFPALVGSIAETATKDGAAAEQARILGLAQVQFGEDAGSKFKAVVTAGTTVEQFKAIMALNPPAAPAAPAVPAAGLEQKMREDLLAAIGQAGKFNVGAGAGGEVTAGKTFEELMTGYRFLHKCTKGEALTACMEAYPKEHEAYLQAANTRKGGTHV